jgi:flavodoxin
MSVTVYYFTGTGNSLAAARAIAAPLGAGLVDIPSALDGDRIQSDSKTIGIVCPAYWGQLPAVVERFVAKLDVEGRYVFLVCTCGGMLHSQNRLRQSIAERRGNLAAVFRVDMPTNKLPRRPPSRKLS